MSFKEDFVWGTATSAYQIEGGALQDGRGLTIWDEFSHTPGKTRFRDHGDNACDSYNRIEEDIEILKELGIKAYRFSISWTRILPKGTGEINPLGLAYYDRLINALIKNNITPFVTLFHWDYPLELYYKGGWLNSDSPKWFAEYVKVVVDHFSDRVQYWVTQNEPECYICNGHEIGRHAPGLQLPRKQVIRAWNHNLVAHGLAVEVIRKNAKLKPYIGIVSCGEVPMPATDSEEDREAAIQAMFNKNDETSLNLSFGDLLDPVILGKYPDRIIPFLPPNYEKDMETIAQPLDFIGLNLYTGFYVKYNVKLGYIRQGEIVGSAETSVEWKVEPKCLYWAPKMVIDRYNLPIYITENGLANNDWVSLEGQVHDPQRVDFIHRYLEELLNLSEEGYKDKIAGYFHWSMLDNYEWARGYAKRFGLVHVDFTTYKRTIKDSGYYFKKVIESNGNIL
ncbi:GH1 family beta-glucosidase [Defluviitalea saccharophila]|uniref:Beta-glucosidase n=1 Tax=Defluviitalea saccharophila TaxID=879970 RepID=A0ABZ2Y305_9FIRM